MVVVKNVHQGCRHLKVQLRWQSLLPVYLPSRLLIRGVKDSLNSGRSLLSHHGGSFYVFPTHPHDEAPSFYQVQVGRELVRWKLPSLYDLSHPSHLLLSCGLSCMGRGLHSSLSSRTWGSLMAISAALGSSGLLTPPCQSSFLLRDRQLMSAAGLFLSLCVSQCPSRTQKPHRYLYKGKLSQKKCGLESWESIPAGESIGQMSLAESVKRMLENTGPGTGGPVVKIPCSQSRDMASIPGLGTKILHA